MFLNSKNLAFKKTVSFGLAILLITPYLLTPRTVAGFFGYSKTESESNNTQYVPTVDKTFVAKETTDDSIMNMLLSVVLSEIMIAITNWANSGFEGSPIFAQVLEKSFSAIQDAAFQKVLNELELAEYSTGFLCSPFSQEIRGALQGWFAYQKSHPSFFKKSRCTLDSVLKEAKTTFADFENDFSKGGWPVWLELTKPKNNRYGSFLSIYQEITGKPEEASTNRERDLNYGRGIFSKVKRGECTFVGPPDPNAPKDQNGEPICPPEYKQPDMVVTPGTVVEEQLNKSLGLGLQRLGIADEFDEMIGALLQNFVQYILFSEDGLFGAGNEGEDGSDSYLDQLQEEADKERENASTTEAESKKDDKKKKYPPPAPCKEPELKEVTSKTTGTIDSATDNVFLTTVTPLVLSPCPEATDTDGDEVPDYADNCPEDKNQKQEDSNEDGFGDACEYRQYMEDPDGDGVINLSDNCPFVPNRDQGDINQDGIGNACQPNDYDKDGWPDYADNCPDVPNPRQTDSDKDGIGDACPGGYYKDADGDSWTNASDNCPFVANRDQVDTDNDKVGDACDNCPAIKNRDQRDWDQNGVGDVCENRQL